MINAHYPEKAEQIYRIFKSLHYTKGKGASEAYGIACVLQEESEPIVVTDISRARDEVESIVETLNRSGVSSEHFVDVVQDIVG